MEREQFTFYKSFFLSVKRIKNNAHRAEAYDAICKYALYGEEPDLDKLPDAAAIAFEVIKPNLAAGRRKAENGKNYGRGQEVKTNSNKIANDSNSIANDSNSIANDSKPIATLQVAIQEQEQEKEKEKVKVKDKEQMLYNPLTPFEGELRDAVEEWLKYKTEINQPYKPMGLQSMVTQMRKAADECGEDAVITLIRNSMASGYKGITFDRLKRRKVTPIQPGGASERSAVLRLEKERVR